VGPFRMAGRGLVLEKDGVLVEACGHRSFSSKVEANIVRPAVMFHRRARDLGLRPVDRAAKVGGVAAPVGTVIFHRALWSPGKCP
ncbi:MAG: hypothetical protein K0M60_03175, partial [Hydrogenophaga sp.]|nr:hypothetical protein [Hydrogenophaga sp.]